MPKKTFASDEERRAYRKEYQAAYRAKNRDKINAQIREWSYLNKEKKRASVLRWRKNNPDRVKANRDKTKVRNAERTRVWCEANRERAYSKAAECRRKNHEKYKALNRAWRKANPEKISALIYKRRLRMKGQLGDDFKKVCAWHQEWRKRKLVSCYWCSGTIRGKDGHLDHIVPIAKGGKHESSNVCISCRFCNLSKKDRDLTNWNARIYQPVLL